jgi:hypothetical protein
MKVFAFTIAASFSLSSLTFVQAEEKQADPGSAPAVIPVKVEAGPAKSAEWLRAKWVFDEEYTQTKYDESAKGDGAQQVRDSLIFPQLHEKLKGAHINVTEKELVMTTKDGNGKAFAYEIVETPDENTVTLKLNDGDVTTYHKEGDRIWSASTGNVNIPFYFKRAK